MAWIVAIILAYLFFALSSLGDKLVLKTPATKAISYTFFAGILNFFVFLLIPLFGLEIPQAAMIFWLAADAAVFLLALYFGFRAVDDFEVSRASATIGGVQPIFIFFIAWMFFGYQGMGVEDFAAFVFLVLGSFLISFEKKPQLTKKFLKLTLFSALMYSFDYVLIKYIYSELGFINGFVMRSFFIGIFALSLLLKKSNRREILKKKNISNKKLQKTFLATQLCGGAAAILQNYGVYLAPVAMLPLANSLRGIQYIFLLVLTSFISKAFPKVLKEEITKKVLAQKIAAIVLIAIGLAAIVL